MLTFKDFDGLNLDSGLKYFFLPVRQKMFSDAYLAGLLMRENFGPQNKQAEKRYRKF